jgi:hypothetical protein
MAGGDAGRRAFVVGLALAALLRISITAELPTTYVASDIDDLFFVRAADHILAGRWLGPFDHRTLVKGVGYPLFLVTAHAFGVPKRLAEDVFLALAALVLAWALRRVGLSRATAFAACVCCLFSPSTYSLPITRTVREGIYGSQTLLVLALGIALVARGTMLARIVISTGLGVTLAWFWQTREESTWILPPLAVLLATIVWCERRRRTSLVGALGCAGLLLIAPVGLAVAGDRWVKAKNAEVYGAPVSAEFKDPDFIGAIAAFGRVAHGRWERFEPLTAETLDALYAVSPALRDLQPTIDGRAWRGAGMTTPSGDRIFWFFVWLVRDATARAGHYASLSQAKAFYRRLADEINAAADRGVVPAGPRRDSLSPVLHPSLHHELVSNWAAGIADMWEFRIPSITTRPADEKASARPEDAALYRRILRESGDPPVDSWLVQRIAILRTFHVFFRTWLRWLALAGAVGLLLQLVLIRRGGNEGLLGIELALLAAIGSRAAVSAVVQTYCWSVWNLYLLCVYPLLPVVSLVAVEAGARRLARAIGPPVPGSEAERSCSSCSGVGTFTGAASRGGSPRSSRASSGTRAP